MQVYARIFLSIPEHSWSFHVIPCNSMQVYASLCKSMRVYARICNNIPDHSWSFHVIPCESMWVYPSLCKSIRVYASPLESMQVHASLCENIPDHSWSLLFIPCNSMRFHVSLCEPLKRCARDSCVCKGMKKTSPFLGEVILIPGMVWHVNKQTIQSTPIYPKHLGMVYLSISLW